MDSVLSKLALVSDIFKIKNLSIPVYQRPYKWKEKNVLQLLTDILKNQTNKKRNYRVGTIIIHKETGYKETIEIQKNNIVDGQQRLVTFTLILYFLGETDLPFLFNEFPHDTSKDNIKFNYQAITNWFKIKNLNSQDKALFKNYLLNHCEFVKIELNDISEAFQFFDSQNSRGKSLEPFDLLKAFHLREMILNTPEEKLKCVIEWENSVNNKLLKKILGQFIFRIRKWAKGENAGTFTKDDIDEFKGINLTEYKSYSYLKPYIINDAVTSKLEKDPINLGYNVDISYPFQLPQMILNGKRFFEFVSHYSKAYNKIFNNILIFNSFHTKYTNYDGSHRTGDQYVKDMFEASILFYFDKFGDVGFENIYPYLFLWAYKLRLKKLSVRYASIDLHIKSETNVFKMISSSYYHNDLLSIKNNLIIAENDVKTQIDKINNLFRENNLISKSI